MYTKKNEKNNKLNNIFNHNNSLMHQLKNFKQELYTFELFVKQMSTF